MITLPFKIVCNNCNAFFSDDSELDSIPEEGYHCPNCKTDAYLMDLSETEYNQRRITIYRDAFTFTTRDADPDKKITILRDNLPEDIRTHLLDVIHQANESAWSLDLAYSIVSDAVDLLPDNIDDLDNFDPYELSTDIASIYTYDRLQYLNINNQYDITQVLREYQQDDIATACAIWYDRLVIDTLSDLVDFFTAE